MSIDGAIGTLVLQEFRLFDPADAVAAARIVAGFPRGVEAAVPLLVSIDDPCDVATVRATHAGEQAEADPKQRDRLDPYVSMWRPPRMYGPRITERSDDPPSYYRLAVTESGINKTDELPTLPQGLGHDGALTHLGLLWIGTPIGTHAGLFVLLGSFEARTTVRPPSCEWPLPMSRPLGVRIYDSAR